MSVQTKIGADTLNAKACAPKGGRAALSTPGERRTAPRVPHELVFDLRCGDHWYPNLRMRDISCDGAFIESGSCSLELNDRVEVYIHVPASGHLQRHRFDAHVTRITGEGVGILFGQATLEAYAALLYLLVK